MTRLAPLPLLLATALCGCSPTEPLAAPKPVQGRVRTFNIPLNATHRYDVLFVLDNTIEVQLLELRNRMNKFLKPFQDLADQGIYADLHLGVVTSDLGAGATGAPGCTPSGPRLGGDQAKLIALGSKAAANCKPPVGANYLAYQFGAMPVHNFPQGQNLLDTLGCMMSVGASGCGFEHPLEAAYAALHNDIPENAGFLRDDAKLLVFFVTDEDDASAPPDTDLFDKNKVAQYGYENSYSRQTRWGVVCGDPGAPPPYDSSHGPLSKCVPAPNRNGNGPGKLYDVSRYIDFFTLPRVSGGLKDSPLDIMMVAIAGPSEPFEVILSNPGAPPGPSYIECGQLNEASNPPCIPVLQRSCVMPENPSFYGDPAVRLNAVVSSVKSNLLVSVCEPDYGPFVTSAAKMLAAGSLACFLDAFPRDANQKLVTDCVVQQVTQNPDGSETRFSVPHCDANGLTVPCWNIKETSACQGLSPDGVSFSVDYGKDGNGKPITPPPHTSALVECATMGS